ncbi:MAG TPA: DUF3857 domain-containing protein [Blastocatellia bacterium]|nr:DUF3857 domain-containing protein [Blastocatellia bacterium]
MRIRVFIWLPGCLFALTLLAMPARAGDDVPQWLRTCASTSAPAYAKKVPAVVLFTEQQDKVDDDGRVTTTERYAVRILTGEGRDYAMATASYRTDGGRVREIRAWMISPSGRVKKYEKNEVADLAMVDNDIYNEARIKAISGRAEAEVGSVFGYEITSEDRSVFTQFTWQFQDRLPTLASRYTLSLPQGWRAEGVTFNHTRIEPTVSGSNYVWELRGLAHIEEEPLSPPVTNIAPLLAVSYFPAPGAKSGIGRTFSGWSDVSRWLSELSDPQMTLDDALAGKARQLVAPAKTELERIRAIGSYVQGINYISIQTGVGRGGGYRPHSSVDVFAKSYGDCKDKANLMRAMLKAVNIQSHLVCIYSGDPTYVREEWPSPQQFNHCIIAIRVSDETEAATIVKHPTLGRLLIFDPTDDNTTVGDLPEHEQGSLALIIAGDAGALVKMPVTPAETNHLDRQAEVVLGLDGSITAKVREQSVGRAAAVERRLYRELSRPEYVKMIEKWITRSVTGATVSKVEPVDDSAAGRFTLNVEFKAPSYGQILQNRLLIFKPAIVARQESLTLTEPTRAHPVVLNQRAFTEAVKVKLPSGFDVDELPDEVKLDTLFGAYSTAYEVKEGYLHFTRKLIVKRATIPVGEYIKVRGFFEKISAAEQAPVVLAKK